MALKVCALLLPMLAVSLAKPQAFSLSARTERALNRSDYRLNNDVLPRQYKIDLTLKDDFFESKEFYGRVQIYLQLNKSLTESDKNITLNTKQIKFKSVQLLSGSKNIIFNASLPSPDETLERISFNLSENNKIEEVKPYVLDIEYIGKLHEDMYGFYLSSYKDENGKVEWLATTQFEPTHARRAFPCFDEPNYKAKFEITITHPAAYRALSNTKIKNEVRNYTNQNIMTTFEPTPSMSSYTVAFVVSKFGSMSINKNEVGENTVWARQEFIETAKYGFSIAPKIITVMNNLTGIKYSEHMSKLDQIAIPDFAAGAMENWGLITYRENYILWNPQESTNTNKEQVGTVVAHELAHMWFGNLVTLDWWSHTWINEGFARFFQYMATAKVEPSWELEYQFLIEQQQTILNTDSLVAAVPLTNKEDEILTPTAIKNKFDSVTYNKGGSVIRMLYHFMGEKKFYEGIKQYLKARSLNNAQPHHLWDAMEKQVDESLKLPGKISEIMTNWTEQAGFPLINVTVSGKNITLTQKRFYSYAVKNETNATWYVPISYTTSENKDFNNTAPKSWLNTTANNTIPEVLKNESTWVILNIQGTAYVRVNYEEELWKRLAKALEKDKFDGIHVLNRATLIDDAMNLARAGVLKYKIALDILSYLKKENSYYPWNSAFKAFAFLRRRFDSASKVATLLTEHILNLMQTLNNEISFENNPQSHTEIRKKVLALDWACELGAKQCVEKSQSIFKPFKENRQSVDPNVRGIVYCTAVRNAQNDTEWKFLRNLLKDTQVATEIPILISSLGCTKDKTLLESYLEESVDPTSGIRKQHASSVFTAVIRGNPEGVQAALEFIQKPNNLKKIKENYGGLGALADIISALADRLTKKVQIDSFKEFIQNNENDLEDAAQSAKTAIESSSENLAWVEKHSKELDEYLEQAINSSTPAPPPPSSSTPASTTKDPNGGAASIVASSITLAAGILVAFIKW